MSRTNCLEETDLIALSLGEVPEQQLLEYVAHLEGCAACEQKVRQYDDLADSMISALRQPVPSQQATNLIVKPAALTPRPASVLSLPTQGLGPVDGAPPLAQPVENEYPDIPGYQILDVLGQGGMGIVFKARQDILNRIVALKMLLPGARMMGGSLSRFCQEAEAVARLQHPNLVQIFQIGLHDDQPFLALEYVDGGSLKDHLGNTPQTPRRAAELTETLARAIDVAHRHHIIHRDLKPANILMQLPDGPLEKDSPAARAGKSTVCNLQYAVPKITDFGLAKQLDNDLQLTQEGVVAGTPCYMAPEQADSKLAPLGPTTDIYSLGVILYELLTGRVPLEGPSVLDTLLLVRGQDPVPPRQLQPKIPADLETICLKCLEKQPGKRYASAQALADDLRRFREGKPIVARPTPRWERAWKWTRRQPIVAGLSAGIVAAVVLGFIGISWQWSSAVQARDDARWQEGQKEVQRRNAVLAEQRAVEERKQAVLAHQRAERERQAKEEQRQKAVAARDEAETNVYFSRIAQARLEWQLNHNIPAARKLLDLCKPREGETERRGWEWYFLNGLNDTELLAFQGQNKGYIERLAYSPDGTLLASAGGGNPFQGSQHVIEPGEVLLFDARTGAHRRTLTGHQAVVTDVKFSPDGRTLASCGYDNLIKVWNVADGALLRTISVTKGGWLFGIAYTPDSQQLVSANGNGSATLWDLNTGEALRQFPCGYRLTASVAVSPDGKLLLTAGQRVQDVSGPVKLWDLATGKEVREFGSAARHSFSNVAFSADGQFLATVDRTARVWDVASGRLLQTFSAETELLAVAFRPDGRQLAAAGADFAVRLWDLQTGEQQMTLRGHASPVHTVAYHPSGRLLASGDITRQAKVWDLTRQPEYTLAQPTRSRYAEGLAFTRQGDRVLCLDRAGELEFRDPVTAATHDARRLDLTSEWLTPGKLATFDTAGERLAVIASSRRQVRLFETATAKELQVLSGPQSALYQVALSGNGQRIAAAGLGNTQTATVREIVVWDGETGKPLLGFHTLAALQNRLYGGLALSADGQFLAFDDYPFEQTARGRERVARVKVCALSAGGAGVQQPRWSLAGHESAVSGLAFSPDGQFLASADQSLVILWDLKTGKRLHDQPLQGPGPQNSCQLAFSPDSKRLALVNREYLKMWDVATGQEVLTLRGAPAPHGDGGFNPQLAWSPDGKRLAAGNWNSSVSVWDVAERAGPAARERERRNADARGFYWHLAFAVQGVGNRDYPLLAFHWRQLQEMTPPDATARLYRTEMYVRLGQWRQAADEFNELYPGQLPNHLHFAYIGACCRVLAGDLAAYRQSTVGLIQRNAIAFKTDIPWTLLCACALTDKSGTNPEVLAGIAKQKLAGKLDNRSVWQHTLALALYRAGQDDPAAAICVQEIEKASAETPPMNMPLLALIRARQGKLEEARQWLEKTKPWRQQLAKGQAQGFPLLLSYPFDMSLQCLVLCREAELVLRAAEKK